MLAIACDQKIIDVRTYISYQFGVIVDKCPNTWISATTLSTQLV
jgi:hypothetical protein